MTTDVLKLINTKNRMRKNLIKHRNHPEFNLIYLKVITYILYIHIKNINGLLEIGRNNIILICFLNIQIFKYFFGIYSEANIC